MKTIETQTTIEKITTVTNVLTKDKATYLNPFSVVYNMVNVIMGMQHLNSNLHNKEMRLKVFEENNLYQEISANGKEYFCFCEKFDLMARQLI